MGYRIEFRCRGKLDQWVLDLHRSEPMQLSHFLATYILFECYWGMRRTASLSVVIKSTDVGVIETPCHENSSYQP